MQLPWKTVKWFLKTTQNDPVPLPLPGICPKEQKAGAQTDFEETPVHSSLVYNCQKAEATRGSTTDEWISKMWSTHTMGYYSAFTGRTFWHTPQHG